MLSDLKGFVLEEEDIKDLKECKSGSCELQLPAASMEEFKKQVNWAALDVATQVNNLGQKMALEALIRYQKEGDSALGSYYDKEHPVHVFEQFESLLREQLVWASPLCRRWRRSSAADASLFLSRTSTPCGVWE